MEENRASVTAQNSAAVRVFETMRPLQEQICNDFLAFYFLSEEITRMTSPPGLKHTLSEIMNTWEMLVPGVCGSIAARTRFMDDCLEKAIENQVEQLVILGAGYDTRAFRFNALKEKVKVFEIDHPATQESKLQRLKKHRAGCDHFITYIPVNFEKENFGKKLFSHGYEPSMRTFYIWEGVSYYLRPGVVDDTLYFISKNSAAASEIVFDYFPASFVAGTCDLPEAPPLKEILKNFGEKILFGISPQKLDDFLKNRGFDVIRNFSSDTYMKACFKGRAPIGRTFSNLFFFVHARIP